MVVATDLGNLLIGTYLNLLLAGASMVQFYYYFHTCQRDVITIKAFVVASLCADIANTVIDAQFVYDYCIQHFGEVSYTFRGNGIVAAPVMLGILAFITQAFFAWRIYRLTHTWVWAVLILVLATIGMLSAAAVTGWFAVIRDFSRVHELKSVNILALVCMASADVVITTILVIFFNKSRTGIKATDDILTKLLCFCLETGTLTTVCVLADLITYLTVKNNIHFAIK